VILFQSTTPAVIAPAGPAMIAVAFAYFATVAAIGIWAARRTRTANDFFLAGRGIGLFALAVSAMAATLSGFAFIGGPGLVYALGFGAVFIVLPAGLTNTMTGWALARRMRMLGDMRGLVTVPDAIGARYDSRVAQGLSGVAILVGIVGYMATNVLAMGIVISAIFGCGLTLGIWIGSAVTLAYSAAGGILAGIYTDVFQGLLMALVSVAVFVFAMGVGGGLGGISRTIMAADPGFLSPWGKVSPLTALSFFFVFSVGAIGQPHVIHKFYMLKDPARLKWYPALMTLALVVTLLLYFGVGIIAKALTIRGELTLARPDDATPAFLLEFTPTILAALVFSGVVAAIMSTVNSFLNVAAAVVAHDLPTAFGRHPTHVLRTARLTTIGLAILAAIVAQLSGSLVAFLGIFGFGLFASTLVPALVIGLNWTGATREGAIASIATGLSFTLVFETLSYFNTWKLPTGVTISGASLALSFIMFFLVCWLTRARAAAQLANDIRSVIDA
jgi:SSS family transporter